MARSVRNRFHRHPTLGVLYDQEDDVEQQVECHHQRLSPRGEHEPAHGLSMAVAEKRGQTELPPEPCFQNRRSLLLDSRGLRFCVRGAVWIETAGADGEDEGENQSEEYDDTSDDVKRISTDV